MLRHVERNALRAKLCDRAEAWRWGSLWRRRFGNAEQQSILVPGPAPLPPNRLDLFNRPQTSGKLEFLRRSILRGSPFGTPTWQAETARRLNLQATLRPRGRPKKETGNE